MIFSCARLNWLKPMRFAGTWSRYSNSATPQDAIAVEQQIEVERARGVGKLARAAEAPLLGEQRFQQGPRGERGLDFGDRVDEVELRDHAHRRAAVKRRCGEEPRPRQLGERSKGAAHLWFGVTEIRSQAYEGFRRRCLLIHRKQSSTRFRLRAEGAAPSRARRRRGESRPVPSRRLRFRASQSVRSEAPLQRDFSGTGTNRCDGPRRLSRIPPRSPREPCRTPRASIARGAAARARPLRGDTRRPCA